MLNVVELEHFREHGFVAVADSFTGREVDPMQTDVERLKDDSLLRNVATDGDGETPSMSLVNLQLCPMHKDSSLFRGLPFHPKCEVPSAR